MSELTPCNLCSLNSIKRCAEKKGLSVTTKSDKHGWISVYVHPPDVTNLSDTDNVKSQYFAASMMEITDHCVC